MITERRFIAYCAALLGVLFLSLIVPVEAKDVRKPAENSAGVVKPVDNNPFSGAIGFSIELEKEFPTEKQPPVEYLEFDIHQRMNGWYTMFVYQLALGVYEEEERQQRITEQRFMKPEQMVSHAMLAFIVVGLLLLLIGVIYHVDYRKP